MDGIPTGPVVRTRGDRQGRTRWYALAVVCTAFFMSVLDSTSVYTALPTIGADLGFSAAGLQWVTITRAGISHVVAFFELRLFARFGLPDTTTPSA